MKSRARAAARLVLLPIRTSVEILVNHKVGWKANDPEDGNDNTNPLPPA
jgi:hypothetical protein